MIRTERQYEEGKKKAAALRTGLKKVEESAMPQKLKVAARGQSSELLREIESEIREFELLRDGKLKEIPLNSIEDLRRAPIRYRIYHHLTIEEFARRVNVNVRQMMRYESDEYSSISLDRLGEIIKRLEDFKMEGRMKIKKGA